MNYLVRNRCPSCGIYLQSWPYMSAKQRQRHTDSRRCAEKKTASEYRDRGYVRGRRNTRGNQLYAEFTAVNYLRQLIIHDAYNRWWIPRDIVLLWEQCGNNVVAFQAALRMGG